MGKSNVTWFLIQWGRQVINFANTIDRGSSVFILSKQDDDFCLAKILYSSSFNKFNVSIVCCEDIYVNPLLHPEKKK